MKVIAKPVGTGKTKELLFDAFMKGAQVLTTNKRALQAKAQAYGFIGVDIIDLEDLAEYNYNLNKPLYIHKITDVMQEILNSDFDKLKLEEVSITVGD